MYLRKAHSAADEPAMKLSVGKGEHAVKVVDERLARNEWLAGETFTAADVMTVFILTTMRLFISFGLEPYPNVLRRLKAVGERPAYRRAMERGEAGFTPLLGARAPELLM